MRSYIHQPILVGLSHVHWQRNAIAKKLLLQTKLRRHTYQSILVQDSHAHWQRSTIAQKLGLGKNWQENMQKTMSNEKYVQFLCVKQQLVGYHLVLVIWLHI